MCVYLNLQSGLQRLNDFTRPFWLALFVEGTRFTEAKLKAAQEYAASSELPVPRNVLIPRTKVSFVVFLFAHSLVGNLISSLKPLTSKMTTSMIDIVFSVVITKLWFVFLFQGFVSAVSNMRSFVPAIYDMTVAIPKTSPPPTMLRLFKGQPSVVSK